MKPAQTVPESAWSRYAPTEQSDIPMPKNLHEDDYIVLDNKKVPNNIMELIEKRLVVMNRTLKRKFGDEAKFTKKLREEVEPDENGNVSCD